MRAWRRLKGAASGALAAVAAPKRGAHSAGADETQDAGFTRGAHSAPAADEGASAVTRGAHSVAAAGNGASARPAGTHSIESGRAASGSASTARPTRPRNTRGVRGAHTARSRRPRVVSARGAHSTGRAPRATIPCNLQTAPAMARGYSMAEVLATVGIIVILCAIVVVNVVSFQANLRQKELDAKAEVIYIAAQEQMTRLMASGRDSLFAPPEEDGGSGSITTSGTGSTGENNGEAQTSALAEESASTPAPMSRYGVRVTPSLPLDVPRDEFGDSTIEEGRICYITSAQLGAVLDPAEPTTTVATALFEDGGLDDSLLNNHWVIEYDYKTLTVYSVYYSETVLCDNDNASNSYTAMFSTAYNSTLRSWAGRLNSADTLGDGCYVGYHGGGSSSGSSASVPLSPELDVVNAEKLVATVRCSKPAVNEDLGFLVTLSDDYGHARKMFFAPSTFNTTRVKLQGATVYKIQDVLTDGTPYETGVKNVTYQKDGSLYTLNIVLDSLDSPESRFNSIYGSAGAGGSQTITESERLVSGSNIYMDVKVLCENGLINAASVDRVSFNSLFANDVGQHKIKDDGVAGISCGRHLQNLDADSGVYEGVTSALQYTNVDFSSTAADNNGYTAWLTTYNGSYYHGVDDDGSPRFEPISNSNIQSYDGAGSISESASPSHSIIHLNINENSSAENAPAGLFGTVSSNLKLSNLSLTGTTIRGKADVGGLVGIHSGNSLEIDKCQLYLNTSTDTPGKTFRNKWMEGASVGGLVGTSTSGMLVINNSSASTVAEATATAGGLVGRIGGGSVVLTNSYADSYLNAQSVGGLVGSGNVATVSSCYSAGYLGGTARNFTAAGLVNGSVGNLTSSYTVCTKYGDYDSSAYYVTAQHVTGSFDKVFYHSSTGTADPQNPGNAKSFDDSKGDVSLRDELGGVAFTVDQKTPSRPYNLMEQSLVSYTWPSIAGVYHYGDWNAGFLPGSLVYYEEYLIGGEHKYGFEGANVKTTLKDLGKEGSDKIVVVGDGYGVVYANDGMPEGQSIEFTLYKGADRTVESCKQTITSASHKIPTTNGYVIYPLGSGGNEDSDGAPNISNTTEVNKDAYFLRAKLGEDYYYFNPHFARTVHAAGADEAPTPPAENEHIFIRTARQLYNLSLHYADYRTVTQGHTFFQERNIAYTEYRWKAYTARSDWNAENQQKGRVFQQAPIAVNSAQSFIATYNGGRHEITDVSFVADNQLYAGMFGYTAKGSTIRNVVLCTDYTPATKNSDSSSDPEGSAGSSESGAGNEGSQEQGTGTESQTEDELDLQSNYYVQHKGQVPTNETVHMGVLAGYNNGTIDNCATAGYFLAGSDGTVHAYANTSTCLGGMVGTNRGTVLNSASDAPKLRLSLYQATTSAGGFVGDNTGGTVDNCYALGTIEVVYSDGGKADIAGFAGNNDGRITNSYCATAITLSGETTVSYGFAPVGGFTYNCEYLNSGTYSYVRKMYSYNFLTASYHTSGVPASYSDMVVLPGQSGAVTRENTSMHSQTNTVSERYPYRGVVTGTEGELVHYGNWQDDVKLGTMGVFYWEHEEGGGNDGYHMTYLGNYEDTTSSTQGLDIVGQSSLCNSHNDDGSITEYGYGFYVQSGQESNLSIKWDNINCSGGADKGSALSAEQVITEAKFNKVASEDFRRQMKSIGISDGGGTSVTEFYFCAFTTQSDTESSSLDYIRLDETIANNSPSVVQNGTLTMSFTPSQERGTITYNFTLSPFFANAFGINSIVEEKTSNHLAIKSAEIKSADDRSTDHYTKGDGGQVGMGDIPYEIRSLQQLQYINWNAKKENTSELVGSDANSYKTFPYLQYATNPNGNSQTREAAQADRPARTWLQTHDVKSIEGWNCEGGRHFSPIAGAATTCTATNNNYSAKLYAWFGGVYDGQSYTITNVSIRSNSYYVGLFGTTAGAGIKNIILHGDSDEAAIERIDTRGQLGAYVVGGLVGVAFNYTGETAPENTITNCAISGYRVVDSSQNPEALGEVCIGGLIGVANVNLKKCSAVTHIVVQPENKGAFGPAGDYIRVGGLVGGLLDTVNDCYTGGSITVGEYLLRATNFTSANEPNRANFKKSAHVFLAGIAGSAFSATFTNFGQTYTTNNDQSYMKVYNSYTYMDFPDMKGTIRSISMIASLADRHTYGKSPSLQNCYYHDESANFSIDLTNYYFTTSGNTLQRMMTEDIRNEMIMGNVDFLRRYLGNNGTANNGSLGLAAGSSVLPRTYDALSSSEFLAEINGSGGPWKPVSSTDKNNVPIDGKFSFPALEELEGMNYPFPTVVVQNDLTFGTVNDPVYVNVHYGDWPILGSYWAKGRASMDIFTDMGENLSGWGNQDQTYAYQVFTLVVDKKTNTDAPTVTSLSSFSYSDNGETFSARSEIAEVVAARKTAYDDQKQRETYEVLVRAMNAGATKIRYGGYESATFTLEVTANWVIEATAANNDIAFDPDISTLWLEKNNDLKAAIALSSHAENPTVKGQGPKVYTDATTWSYSSDKDNLLSYPKGEEATSLLEVTRTGNGTVVLTATASYVYHKNAAGEDVVFQQKLFITVEDAINVGLSNAVTMNGNALDASKQLFNEVLLGGKNKSGQNKTYGNAEKPSYSSDTSNIFLYAPPTSAYLKIGMPIVGITVDDGGGVESVENGVFDYSKKYNVTFDAEDSKQSGRSCLPGVVSYYSQAPEEDAVLSITITLRGGYELKTEIPADRVKPVGTSLTLVRGTDTATKQILGALKGTDTLVGYNRSLFEQDGCTLDGWYDGLTATARKVLDANGKVAGNVEGITESKKFALNGNVTLYAKWRKSGVAWVQATSIDFNKKYVLVAKDASGNAHVLFRPAGAQVVVAKGAERGYALGVDESQVFGSDVSASGAVYEDCLEGTSFTDWYQWERAEFIDEDEPDENKKRTDKALVNLETREYLAENNHGIANNYWGVFAAPKAMIAERTDGRINRVASSIKNGTPKGLYIESGHEVYLVPNSDCTIACNTGNKGDPRVLVYTQTEAEVEFLSSQYVAESSETTLNTLSLRSGALVDRLVGLDLFAASNPARTPEQRKRRTRR